jgi:hypothetical protein
MRRRAVVALAALSLLASLSPPASRAQTVPACPRGSGVLTPVALGSLIIREGSGLGAVTLGSSAADVERAWSQPSECLPLQRGYTYNYLLSDDGGQTGLLLVVVIYQDRVEQILATLTPHSGGRGPALRTRRGVSIMDPVQDVRRVYGTSTLESQNAIGYVAEGVAFQISREVVGGILVFPAGSVPPDWRVEP